MVELYKKLPIWGQVIVWALIAFTGYKIYQWAKRKYEAGNYQAPVAQAQTALNQLAQQGIIPSYAQAEYSTSANSLQKIFEGCTLAGDSASGWEIIEGVFGKMKNDADIYALIKAYGVRTTDKCGLFTGDITADLATTISEHFSGSEQFLIKHSISDINDILKKNSIVFTF